jgi:protein-S-isoprenylcysteine O-methyltransferase Ste14
MGNSISDIRWTDWILLATYAAQIIQLCCCSVPSAGSTFEMLTRVRKNRTAAGNHPSAAALQSPIIVTMLLAATTGVIVTWLMPAAALFFRPAADYLIPVLPLRQSGWAAFGSLLLIIGNIISYMGVAALRRHVTFNEFGETDRLHTAGIYSRIRHPITLGVGCIFAGFFFYLPTVGMLCGGCLFALNSIHRIRMEETYLRRTFGERYIRYQGQTRMFFPRRRPVKLQPRARHGGCHVYGFRQSRSDRASLFDRRRLGRGK